MSFKLCLDLAENQACERRDAIVECADPCGYVSQLRYGRENETKYRSLFWDLLRISFYNSIINTDNVVGNELDAEIPDNRILVHGDSFGILVTTS